MADTLCGPSNPLQNFQKHASVDRTLQQDRLTSRAGPSQGFRSNPGPNAGLLDPEFEAFQAGHSPAFPDSQLLHHSRQNFSHSPAAVPQYASNVGGWASDFQRLHISQPSTPQSQLRPQPAATAWHLDFQRQVQSPSLQQPQQTPQLQHTQPRYNLFQGPDMQSPYYSNPPFAQNMQPNNILAQPSQQEDYYDAEAFEKQFQAHASRLLKQRYIEDVWASMGNSRHVEPHSEQRSTELGQDVLVDGPDVLQSFDENIIHSDFGSVEGSQRQRMPANDYEELSAQTDELMRNLREEAAQRDAVDSAVAEDEAKQDMQDRATTDEDLARTAGELLQRVADDTSTKFRESSFLSLMAQLRDREVRVEGNDIVANDTIAADPAVKSAPLFETSATRQRPSSVPPRRRVHEEDWPAHNLKMAGALHDADMRADNSGVPAGQRAQSQSRSENFQQWLAENGLPGTHMVNDF